MLKMMNYKINLILNKRWKIFNNVLIFKEWLIVLALMDYNYLNIFTKFSMDS